jgi:hypothetical protein
MHFKNTLLKFIFAYLVFCFHSTIAIANAPSSLVGKKIVLSIPDPENSREYRITWIFTTNDELWEFEHENGDWQWAKYEYVKSGSRITAKSVPYHAGGSYDQFILDYTTSTSGNISYTAFEKNDSGNFEIDDQGSATFTMSDYANTDLPPFGTYFSDDFSNSTISESYWYENTETSWYGLNVNLGNGKLELTGLGTDLEERWFDVNTKSILSVNEDWVIQADAFAEYAGTSNETWNTVIGFEAEYQQYDFEFFVGPSSWGTIAYISYEDPDGTFVHLSATFGNSKTGSYRVRNDISRKTFYAEYLEGSSWKETIQVNWQSGAVTGATYSDNGNTDQLSNWISLENYKVQPGITFSIPSDGTKIGNLSSSQLGVSSFAVTEGAPEPDPEYAPSSLVGKIYKGSMNDTYQFIDESNAIFYHKKYNFQSSEVSSITYTWSPNGNSGTLTTSLNETTTLSFTSAVEGSFSWNEQESGETSSGTFTLEEATTGNAPSSLVGDSMIAGTKTYIFKENGVVTIRTTTGSQDTTYGFVKSANNEIVFNIPAHADGVTSTIYKMTFTSTGEGTLSEGGSGSFQYFIDGSNQPSTKGWMWFDEYPWVYSNVEAGWLYFKPTGSKLMVYSIKDQAWREMTE